MTGPRVVPAYGFGINVSPVVGSSVEPIAAQTAEGLGFDFLSVNDHLHGPQSCLEAWTVLSWIAASTTRIRVATRVLGLPYRHPVVLAKMAETFDRLSGGRLILGLGAGSGEAEFEAIGLNAPPLRDRLTAPEEAITIARGRLVRVDPDVRGSSSTAPTLSRSSAKPAHAIPIWLGTVGARGLTLAGRLADGWIPSLEFAPRIAWPR